MRIIVIHRCVECSELGTVSAVVADRAPWQEAVDDLFAALGWRRLVGTKDIRCPEHAAGMVCVVCRTAPCQNEDVETPHLDARFA